MTRTKLFSAYAEVFPAGGRIPQIHDPFLCLRRGVSSRSADAKPILVFSLPTQRCFSWTTLSPSSVSTFLCLRRGVSRPKNRGYLHNFFSLPTQRCFPPVGIPGDAKELFSAYAEVFPALKIGGEYVVSFLCLRRDVSSVS